MYEATAFASSPTQASGSPSGIVPAMISASSCNRQIADQRIGITVRIPFPHRTMAFRAHVCVDRLANRLPIGTQGLIGDQNQSKRGNGNEDGVDNSHGRNCGGDGAGETV